MSTETALRFGRFEWRPQQRTLWSEGRAVALGSRAFDVLSALIQARDRIVSKDELLDQVWRGVVVEENNLTVQISSLRKVLGDEVIATVAGRGYRFAAALNASDESARSRRAKPSVAVLPFANVAHNPDDDYFCDGLAEDITTGLSRSPWLFVAATTTCSQWRGSTAPPAHIGRQLAVEYLLQGSVRRTASAMRVSATLAHAASGDVAWSGHYDSPLTDLFKVQDDITAKVVGTIEPAFLKQEERHAFNAAPRDLQHWDLLMRARWHYWRSAKRDLDEAKRLLTEALRRRPDEPMALSLLAFSLATEVWSGWAVNAKATAIEARKVATRAVAINDADAFAHFTLGVTLLGFGEIDSAMAEHRRALDLYPHFAAASAELGRLMAFRGQTAEGRALIRQAIEDSPTEPRMSLWMFGLGIASFVDERYAEGVQHARTAIAFRPDWYFNHLLLAVCLVRIGEEPQARSSLAEGVRMSPKVGLDALLVGHPFGRAEDRERYVSSLRQAGWTA